MADPFLSLVFSTSTGIVRTSVLTHIFLPPTSPPPHTHCFLFLRRLWRKTMSLLTSCVCVIIKLKTLILSLIYKILYSLFTAQVVFCAQYILHIIDHYIHFDIFNHHHQHHQSLNREGRWGTTDDFATSFPHVPRSQLPSGTCRTPGLSIP